MVHHGLLSKQGGIYFKINFLCKLLDTGYSCGQHGTVIKTTDKGNNWSIIPVPITEEFASLFFTDVNTGYFNRVITEQYIITKDACGSFSGSTPATSNFIRNVFFIDQTQGWAVGEYGTILHTTNGGN